MSWTFWGGHWPQSREVRENHYRTGFDSIEAIILKPQTQRALPIDRSTHGVGGLTIAQTVCKLEDGDQCQQCGIFSRLPLLGIEVRELGIGEDRSERVVDSEVGIPTRESPPSDPASFVGETISQFSAMR